MTGACSLNAMFRQLQAAFMEWAERWTLADLSNPQIIENAGRKAKEWAEAETEKGRKYH
jgi:Rrf2 family nitric oxide-sensitive transcriptional repressor